MTPSSRKVEETGSRATAPLSLEKEKETSAAQPLKSALGLPEELASSKPLKEMAERFEKVPPENEKVERAAASSLRARSSSAHTLSDRERRTQLRALRQADQQVRTGTHSFLNIDLSQAKQSAEEAVERFEDEAKDSSNLMMRINDQDERQPCLIDWGESIDHSELQKLDGSVAFDRVAWKAPSPAFTPYGLVSQLRIAANRLDPNNNISSRDRSRRLDELFNLRKKLDLFNTAVAIVQILNNRESAFSYEKIRTEGATRGEHEPQVEELLRNIPSGIPVEMQAFLKKTLQENFETNSLYQK